MESEIRFRVVLVHVEIVQYLRMSCSGRDTGLLHEIWNIVTVNK